MTLQPDGAGLVPFDEAEGVHAPATPDGRPGFLSDVIMDLGFAARPVVDAAVEESRSIGKAPEQILIENGAITEDQLAISIAERNGLPYVDLLKFRVDPQAARLVDSDTARRYHAMPIAFDATGALVVALSDPMDALAVSDIGVITKSEVRPAVAAESAIDVLLRTLPPSKRRVRLSAHGPDGIATARAAEPGEWTLSRSIATTDAGPQVQEFMPDPMLEPATGEHPVVPAGPAGAATGLEGRIDALVAAALEKRLGGTGEAAGPADDAALQQAQADLERAQDELAMTRVELEQSREEVARAREDAEQARAEIAALSARIEQLEGAVPVAAPQVAQAVPEITFDDPPAADITFDAAPAVVPESEQADSRFEDHVARVMRELQEPGV